MTLLEVAKHALEAMEDAMYRADTHEFYDAKESLRYAIEQAEQAEQEPVGWQWLNTCNYRKKLPANAIPEHWRPLYTSAPTPRKPLTDEEIKAMWQNTSPYYDHQDFARAIEAAHGITGEQT